MNRYACIPLPWPRRLRYLLGRLIFGRGLFAPYHERHRWQTRSLNRRGPARRRPGAPARPTSLPVEAR
jgi:hypothetical protein